MSGTVFGCCASPTRFGRRVPCVTDVAPISLGLNTGCAAVDYRLANFDIMSQPPSGWRTVFHRADRHPSCDVTRASRTHFFVHLAVGMSVTRKNGLLRSGP